MCGCGCDCVGVIVCVCVCDCMVDEGSVWVGSLGAALIAALKYVCVGG